MHGQAGVVLSLFWASGRSASTGCGSMVVGAPWDRGRGHSPIHEKTGQFGHRFFERRNLLILSLKHLMCRSLEHSDLLVVI